MGDVAHARWQKDDQLHLTLRFIGTVDRHQATDIADALRAICFPCFDIALSGVGLFDRKGHVDALWAGVQPHPPLTRLHHKVDRACVQAGLPPDTRAYLPHITLARFGRTAMGDVDSFVAHHTTLTSAPFAVDGFILYESLLGQEGATYTMVERYRTPDRSDMSAP